MGWLLQEEQPNVSSCPCGGLSLGQHDCPWDLGQLMGVGWVILDPPAGIASAVEWLVPMLDKVLRDLSPWSPPDAGHSGEEPAGGLRKAR